MKPAPAMLFDDDMPVLAGYVVSVKTKTETLTFGFDTLSDAQELLDKVRSKMLYKHGVLTVMQNGDVFVVKNTDLKDVRLLTNKKSVQQNKEAA